MTGKAGVGEGEPPEAILAAAEFILEGLHAHKRIGRTEERVFVAGERQRTRAEADEFDSPWDPQARNRRQYN